MSVFHGLSAGNVGHGPLGAAVVVVVGAAVVVVGGCVVVVVGDAVVVVVGRVVWVGRVVVVVTGFFAVVCVGAGSQAPSSPITSRRTPTRRMSLRSAHKPPHLSPNAVGGAREGASGFST